MPVICFRNCRHPFGGSLSFDVEVNGKYPGGDACIMLSQPSETYKGTELVAPTAYFSIPGTSVEDARAIVDAIGAYHLCGKFRTGEPINVSLCWHGAPEVNWQITA